jgi:protein-disulfide isomerase
MELEHKERGADSKAARQPRASWHSKYKVVWWLAMVVFAKIVNAHPHQFKSGEHFKILHNVVRPSLPEEKITPKDQSGLTSGNLKSTEKPQVIIFFNYGCYGCWVLNKDMKPWQEQHQTKIDFQYCPVVHNSLWEKLARFYYVNKALLPSQVEDEVFSSIHNQRRKLWLEAEMINFYTEKKISAENFLQKYKSFDVDRKIQKAKEAANAYEINVTPNIIVNANQKSYMVNLAMVPNLETLFKVIEFIIKENPNS